MAVMSGHRILSLWFPRLGAERLLRGLRGLEARPFAVVAEQSNMQVITSLSASAAAAGLHVGQPVRDAHAMCADLMTRSRNGPAEAAFLTALRRWAGKFSPWVAEEAPDGLVIDLTGCAHLFGGEEALLEVIEADCGDMGLTVRPGIADSLGAAWAMARYSGQAAVSGRSGDAIDQEARATRSRAGKRRHWTRGGAAPQAVMQQPSRAERIVPPGQG
jgi:protein ImuB